MRIRRLRASSPTHLLPKFGLCLAAAEGKEQSIELQAALSEALMIDQKSGRIINISLIVGQTGFAMGCPTVAFRPRWSARGGLRPGRLTAKTR
jgi:hypothetical protein